jgi:hypothetical protein
LKLRTLDESKENAMQRVKWIMVVASVVIAACLAFERGRVAQAQQGQAAASADPAALERARKTVRMLDDIYKQAVVLITDKYVNKEDDFPAGSAAVALFANISKAGWHQVRLLDATGSPYEPKNVAQDDFEREGIRRLKSGEATYEQVIRQDGAWRLRALTPIPVVMQKCVMCHDHYATAKPGEPVGAISYSVPIE